MDALRLRRNPWITALACLPFAAIPIAWLLYPPLWLLTPHLAILGLVALLAAWQRKPFATHEPVQVSVTQDVLRVGDAEHPRERITGAQLLPMPGKSPIVRVSLRMRPDVDVIVRDEDDAHRLIHALGFDPSQTTATFRGASLALVRYRWLGLLALPIFFALGIVSKFVQPIGTLILPLTMLALLPLVLWPSSLTVGVDGVLLRWLWVREFIPTTKIDFVGRFQSSGRSRLRGVQIQTEGRTIKIPIRTGFAQEEIAIVEKRIDEAVALARSGTHVADDALLLSRGEIGLRDWISRLRAIGAGATAQLRVAPVMPERLWRIALDPVAPGPARAAAAVALSSGLDDEGRARLTEAAKATAAPRLRVALENAARGATDEELEESLKELEAEG